MRRPGAIVTCIVGIVIGTALPVVYGASTGNTGQQYDDDGGDDDNSSWAAAEGGSYSTQFTGMEFIIPLYTPPYHGLIRSAQWELLKSTATAGVAVVGIMNPNSGPGIATDPGYMAAIDDVQTSGAQLICYIATGYGAKSYNDVRADIKAYDLLYPGACDGIFFDETPRFLGTLAAKYRSYNTLAHSSFDTTEVQARVMFNPGQYADDVYFGFSPPACIVGYENYYYTMDSVVPATSAASREGNNVLLVHSASALAQNENLIYDLVHEVFCKGWSPIYVTDDVMPNPWDVPPTFWDTLLDAAKELPVECH